MILHKALKFFFCFFFNRLSQFIRTVDLGICNGDFNLHARLNTDGRNLLNYLGGAVQVNEALVDSHLETIPRLGVFTTRCFSCSDPQGLGGHAHRPLHFQVLLLGASDQVGTHLLQRVSVIRMRWIATSGSTGVFPVSLKAIAAARAS